MFPEIAYSIIVLAALALGSHRFNKHVDETQLEDRPDGLTAYWVGIGCVYSVAGATLLLAIWRPHLPADATLWTIDVFCLTILAFIAAGVPMLSGDVMRSVTVRNRREKDVSLQ